MNSCQCTCHVNNIKFVEKACCVCKEVPTNLEIQIEVIEKALDDIVRVLNEHTKVLNKEKVTPYKCPTCKGKGIVWG